MKKLFILTLLAIFISGCSTSESENIKIIDMVMSEEQILKTIEIYKQEMLGELRQHPDASGVNFDDKESVNKFIRSLLGRYAGQPMYGSVWFSPATGEIAPIGPNGSYPDYGRPDSSYIIWIEPGDPEFRIPKKFRFDKGTPYGIQYIGDGETLFNNSHSKSDLLDRWSNDLIEDNSSGPKKYNDTESFEKLAEKNSVFYISTPEGDCVIMIMDYYGIWPEGQSEEDGPTRAYNLRFKWKKA